MHFCRLYHVFKDFCGVVSEDSLQENLLLILEVLNEYMVSRRDADLDFIADACFMMRFLSLMPTVTNTCTPEN